MKRRDFLKTSVPVMTLPMLLSGQAIGAYKNNALMNTLKRMTEDSDRVLVLIQLNGGNDGLNTVIPIDQYSNLNNARSQLMIPEGQILSIRDDVGLHPAMQGIKILYDEERIGIVQSVGYPNPNFSHFRGTDIWTSASSSSEVIDTGWLGRYLNKLHPEFPEGYPNEENPHPLAITIGSVVSQTCQGPAVNMGMAINDPNTFYNLVEGTVDDAPDTPAGHELTYIRQIMQQTNEYTEAIRNAAQMGNNLSTLYPDAGQNSLADQMKIVANLISGGLQTKIYVVTIGGFDTHAFQVPITGSTSTGTHATLLGNISQAIQAFQDDLELLGVGDRVVGMTFSEFGRRIKANLSYGTDHGAAAPLIVFGTNVNPIIHGANPDIPSTVSVYDNLPMQFDFRSVYWSMLQDWFSLSQSDLNELLFEDFQYIPILHPRVTGNIEHLEDKSLLLFQNYPNPFQRQTRIKFYTKRARKITIRIFNNTGKEIKTILNQKVGMGMHEIDFDARGLRTGNYYIRLQAGDKQLMRTMIVM